MRQKLFFIITGLKPNGAENMLFKLLMHIDKSIFDISVFSLTSKGEVGARLEQLNIKVMPMNISNPFNLITGLFRLYKLLKASNPNIVHTWMYHADLIGGIAAKIAGVKIICWGIHHSNLSIKLNKLSTIFVAYLCRILSHYIPSKITACSYKSIEVHSKFGYAHEKLIMLPLGFEVDKFRRNIRLKLKIKSELGIPLDFKTVGIIGRFDPLKNHVGFIHMASSLVKMFPDVRFLMVGEFINDDNKLLTSLISELNLSKYIYLLGKSTEVAELINGLDVLVSTSFGEGFPNILGEAMLTGVPCVATDVGDCSIIIGRNESIAVSGDMISIAHKVNHILNMQVDEYLNLSNSARSHIQKFYEIKHVANIYHNFYLSLIEQYEPQAEKN